MTKHTPGPWLQDGRTVYVLENGENRFYAGFYAGRNCPGEEAVANATLAAVAPELLDALKDMVSLVKSRCYPQPDKPSSDWGRAEAAEMIINKATGKK